MTIILLSLIFVIALIIINVFQHNRKATYALLRRNAYIKKQSEELTRCQENLKVSELKLVQYEKMASLGQQTAGIAHELKNPLNFISGGIESLQASIGQLYNEEPESDDEKFSSLKLDIINAINCISKGVERSSKIINSLKLFSSPQEKEFVLASVEECVDTALTILASKLKDENIQLKKDFANELSILANPSSLSRVFLNIIDNAIDSMKHSDTKILTIKTLPSTNGKVIVVIEDTGCGFNSSISSKIFDPFFTTKEIGKGTGLGLSITSEIIKHHGGTITFQSELNKGTEFSISLNGILTSQSQPNFKPETDHCNCF